MLSLILLLLVPLVASNQRLRTAVPLIHETSIPDLNRKSISILLQQKEDGTYYTVIKVGTPPRPFNVTFVTTGLTVPYLPFTCGNPCGNKTTRYDPSVSSSSTQGDGGMLGVIGLGPSWLESSSLLDNMKAQGLIDQKTVAFSFGGGSKENKLIIGGFDEKSFQGTINYFEATPLIDDRVSENFSPFSTRLYDVQFGPANFKGRFSWLIPNGVIAIDPFLRGLNAAPAAKLSRIAKQLGGEMDEATGLYRLPCNGTGPDLEIELYSFDEKYSLSYNDYVFRKPSGECYLAFLKSEDLMPENTFWSSILWVFGYSFMRKYYTIFDHENHIIGFAEAAY